MMPPSKSFAYNAQKLNGTAEATSFDPCAKATSFAIALIPCVAFLLDLGRTAVLTTLTVGLMVSYILDSLNFKPAAFFDGFDDF